MYSGICFLLFLGVLDAQETSSSMPDIKNNTSISISISRDKNATLESNSTDSDDDGNPPDVSNVHFHLTVPRYYSPFEEIPFLYFVNASTDKYNNQKKYYFNLHMGSSPYTPTYGLFLLNLTVGTYMFHIGRAYNRTWMADAVNSTDNSTYTQTLEVCQISSYYFNLSFGIYPHTQIVDAHTTISYEINVTAWSDLLGEVFSQSPNSSFDRVFLLRTHYKTFDCDQERRVWMYLPPDYERAPSKRYPVIYTHWGQLAFDFHNDSQEWKLDRLFNDAFYNASSCDALRWGFIIVAVEALSDQLSSTMEYVVSRDERGCRSGNLIRTFAGSFKRHIHANFRTLNQWDYTTMIGYGTAGGLVFDLMTKYYQKFGKFIILSWILDEACCESEVEISDALATSTMFRQGSRSQKNQGKKAAPFPKIYFTWTSGEEAAEITRARDNAKGLRHRGMPASNIYVDPVNQTNVTGFFYGNQILKAVCWLFGNQSISSYSDIAPWWDEETGEKSNR